jgi:hypothetical protein
MPSIKIFTNLLKFISNIGTQIPPTYGVALQFPNEGRYKGKKLKDLFVTSLFSHDWELLSM